MIVFERQLAQVLRAALWRNRPHRVRQVLRPKLGGWTDLVNFGADDYAAMAAVHVGIALGLRHKRCAHHANFGFSSKMAVIHCFDCPAYNLDFEQRYSLTGFGCTSTLGVAVRILLCGWLRRGIGNLRGNKSGQQQT